MIDKVIIGSVTFEVLGLKSSSVLLVIHSLTKNLNFNCTEFQKMEMSNEKSKEECLV